MTATMAVSVAPGEQTTMPRRSLNQLQETAWRLSRHILEMTTTAGSGHPSSSLSAIDIMTGLYFGGVLRYNPMEPDWPRRDRFILSKGHAAPALYAVLAEAGYFPTEELNSLRQLGSRLEGHPNRRRLVGVEASTGSLGQGLSIGLGHALGARLDHRDYRVYVLLGDGEIDEGQVWEAAMTAAKYKVDNLTAILDYNEYQQTGAVNTVMPSLEPLIDKWEAFGWYVLEIDGHRMEAVMEAFQSARTVTQQPQMIIAHTTKGRNLASFMANTVNRKHGEPLTESELTATLAELDGQKMWDLYSEVADELSPALVNGGLHR
jgi:transketolase